jgi:hypothetical protein
VIFIDAAAWCCGRQPDQKRSLERRQKPLRPCRELVGEADLEKDRGQHAQLRRPVGNPTGAPSELNTVASHGGRTPRYAGGGPADSPRSPSPPTSRDGGLSRARLGPSDRACAAGDWGDIPRDFPFRGGVAIPDVVVHGVRRDRRSLFRRVLSHTAEVNPGWLPGPRSTATPKMVPSHTWARRRSSRSSLRH